MASTPLARPALFSPARAGPLGESFPHEHGQRGLAGTLRVQPAGLCHGALSISFFWGSLAFFAPRAAEEINTPLVRLFDHLKLFPLDGLSGVMLNGLLTVVPVGFVAWYPCRALLGHAARVVRCVDNAPGRCAVCAAGGRHVSTRHAPL